MTDRDYREKLKSIRDRMTIITKDIQHTAKYNALMVSPPKELSDLDQEFLDLSNKMCFIANPENEEWLLYQNNRDDYIQQAESLITEIAVLITNIDWTK